MANGLPEGFVIETEPASSGLPPGFQLETQAPSVPIADSSLDPRIELQDLIIRQSRGETGLEAEISQLRGILGIGGDVGRTATPGIRPFPEQAGETRAASDLPELGSGGLLSNVDAATKLRIAALATVTTDNEELADIVANTVPGIGKTFSPGGEIILTNNETGARVIVNKKGLSTLDLIQGLGLAAAFTPAGRAVTLGTQGAKLGARVLGQRAAIGAGTSALTQSAIEGTQTLGGGQFDPEEIAVAGAFGAAAEVAVPALGSASRRIRDFIRAKPSQEAAEIIATGVARDVSVLTSDVVPPETFFGKSIQQLGEKIGALGTGGTRAGQQKARQEVVQALADEFNITSVNDDFLPQIIDSLSTQQAKELGKAATQRNRAVAKLVEFGNVPTTRTIIAINEQLARQARLKAKADTSLVNNLNAIKASINGDFSLVKDIRTEVISDLRALARGDDDRALGALQSVKSAIDKDLVAFARKNNKQAASDWLQSNRKFAFELGKSKQTELKRLLQKGDVTPAVVTPLLKSGDPTVLKRLASSLTPKGRANARSAILKDALDSSGFFTSPNPDRLVTFLERPKTQRALDAFFKGDERKKLSGLVKLLSATRRAQSAAVSTPTGQQLIPITLLGGVVTAPLTTLLTATSLAGITRGFESKAMRTVLLKLASAKKGSKEESKLLRELTPTINGILQGLQQTQEDNQ